MYLILFNWTAESCTIKYYWTPLVNPNIFISNWKSKNILSPVSFKLQSCILPCWSILVIQTFLTTNCNANWCLGVPHLCQVKTQSSKTPLYPALTKTSWHEIFTNLIILLFLNEGITLQNQSRLLEQQVLKTVSAEFVLLMDHLF